MRLENHCTHFPNHRPCIPAFRLRLLETCGERCGRDVPIGRVTGVCGLSNHELVETDTAGCDLKEC